MGISIHIDDVSRESKEALTDLGNYLLRVAGAPTVETHPLRVVAPDVPHPHVPGLSVVVPPAPSVSVAPPAPSLPPTTIPPVSGTNLDSRGYPWDARIHAESKSKNNDGTWRYRRGVKDDVIQPVEAELRGVMGVKLTALQEEDTAPIVPQEGEPVVAVPPAPAASDVPPPPPTAPATGGSSAGDDFNHLVNIASKALAAKTITQAQITAILGEVGSEAGCVLPHLGALFTRKDLVPEVRARLQAVIAAGGAQ